MIISRLANEFYDKKMQLAGSSGIQLTENKCMNIENCGGIITYNENLIKLRLSENILTVVGSDFRITCYSDNGVIISGEIYSLQFDKITEKRRK